jgi:hypothetical protein
VYNEFGKTKTQEKPGMIDIELTEDRIISQGGLLLAAEGARKIGLHEVGASLGKWAGSALCQMFGVIAQGICSYAAVDSRSAGEFFNTAFNLGKSYTADTVRQYLGKLAAFKDDIVRQIGEANLRLLKHARPGWVMVGGLSYIPVDMDTTPMDNSKSRKECVSYTYKGFKGFHPMMAYVGLEGYMLESELRPGSQHCQNGTPEFIRRCIGFLKKLWPGRRYLFRLDSGNDAAETIAAITRNEDGTVSKQRKLIIKRNKRKESDTAWMILAAKQWAAGRCVKTEPRTGKQVYIGMTREWT